MSIYEKEERGVVRKRGGDKSLCLPKGRECPTLP